MDIFLKDFFRRKEMLAGFILLTIGCAPQLYWAKPDAQPGEFEADVSQCRQTLMSDPDDDQGISETLSRVFKLSEDAVGQCLMAKGWFLAEKP